MKNPYLAALRLVHAGRNEFSCCAIDRAVLGTKYYVRGPSHEARRFQAVFAPECDHGAFWLNAAVGYGLLDRQDKHAWRLTALAFAAAMHEAGDL